MPPKRKDRDYGNSAKPTRKSETPSLSDKMKIVDVIKEKKIVCRSWTNVQ
jgi:hypothetical protein